jgi:hypothetical protein
MGRRRVVHQDKKRGNLRCHCLNSPQIEEASRSPTSTTSATTKYDELAEGVGSAHCEVEHPDSA